MPHFSFPALFEFHREDDMGEAEKAALEQMNAKLQAGEVLDPEESGNWLYFMLAEMGVAALGERSDDYGHRLTIMDSYVRLHRDRIQFTSEEYNRWRTLYASGLTETPSSLRTHHRELMQFWEDYRA
jgi:hypothetical protein